MTVDDTLPAERAHIRNFVVGEDPVTQTIGVVLLEADHSVETLAFADPYAWRPPETLPRGFFGHPETWPVPALFAVARGATAKATADADPTALHEVAAAVGRLDGHCDLIVGGCGFFAAATPLLADRRPQTPTLLSALDLLTPTLRATSRSVTILSFSDTPVKRFVADHPCRARIRVAGISPAGDWPLIGRPDWAVSPQWTMSGVEAGIREVLVAEQAPGGVLDGVGAVLLECTVLPQFRSVIREYTDAPIVDVLRGAEALLG